MGGGSRETRVEALVSVAEKRGNIDSYAFSPTFPWSFPRPARPALTKAARPATIPGGNRWPRGVPAGMPDRRAILCLVVLAIVARGAAVLVLQSHMVPNSTYEHGAIAESLLRIVAAKRDFLSMK